MRDIDVNEQIVVYAVFNGIGRWYISCKDVWFLDYTKWIESFRKAGYEIRMEYLNDTRQDLLDLNEKTVPVFMCRVEEDMCTAEQLREIYFANNEDPDCLPSLYADFDKKVLYSVYTEPASYEDFAPSDWQAEYSDFHNLIPADEQYWVKENTEE